MYRMLLLVLLILVAVPSAAAQSGAKGAADPKGLVPPPKAWAAQVSPNDFTLVWGRVPAATAYEVLVRNAQGTLVRLGQLSASGSRFIVPFARLSALGIMLDQVQFAVRALNGAVQGPVAMFNPVSTAKQSAAKALVAPANAVARETSPGVVTVTWDEVDGATAYAIGRSVGTYGYQRFCDLCPTGGVLVDTVPTAGTDYSYSITAVTPTGRSRAAMTKEVVVTRLATGAGGAVVTGGGPQLDPKGLAAGVMVTARPLGSTLIQVLVSFATQQGGVAGELVRKLCNGTEQVIRRFDSLSPIDIEDRIGSPNVQACNPVEKQRVRYYVRIRDAKGLAANSKEAVADLQVASADTTAGALDPKGLVAGITVTPRLTSGGGGGGGGMLGGIARIAVRIARQVGLNVGRQAGSQIAHLMRQVCNGPWVVVRQVSLAQDVVNVDDVVENLDTQCGSGKQLVRYQVRVSDAKGLVANSKDAAVEVPASTAADTTAAPDPKSLAAGITVTPRVAGRSNLGTIVGIVVRTMNQIGLGREAGMAVHMMRRVCNGPWVAVRSFSLSQQVVDLEDVVSDVDEYCVSGPRSVQYQVRISTAKGLAENSKAGVVTLPAVEPAATEPPATPGNRRLATTSTGRRTLMWDAVPGATSYRIERLAGAKGAWTVVQELPGTATTWTDTARVDGTPQYRITAVNRAGNSATGAFR